MDAAVYMRLCDGGFLWGVYEDNPTFFDRARVVLVSSSRINEFLTSIAPV
jgi:hypothetical protein